jgi:small subunit ribosomal protein S3
MGQKVHPTGIRLGIVKDWTSKWYADSKHYANFLNSDLEVRDYLKKRLSQASVSRIQIDRPANNAHITVHTARPGLVIGKKGEDIDALRGEVSRMMGVPVHMSIEEIRKPELDAQLAGRHRPAIGAPRDVPAGHEALCTERDALGGGRHQGQHCGPSEWG